MILVGELEFNKPQFYPDGKSGFLFVGTSSYKDGEGNNKLLYDYSISPYPEFNSRYLGDNYRSMKHMSVQEFLQDLVNGDELIGRGVILSFKEAQVRIKGIGDWIKRTEEVKTEQL